MNRKIVIFIASFFAILTVKASDADYFAFNEAEFSNQMGDLIQLEQRVLENGLDNDFLNLFVSLDNNLPYSDLGIYQSNPTILPPFIWGCLGGPIGMAVVYVISDQDSKATVKSFWGCLLGSCVWGSFSARYFY